MTHGGKLERNAQETCALLLEKVLNEMPFLETWSLARDFRSEKESKIYFF